jgi:hypothetical protein
MPAPGKPGELRASKNAWESPGLGVSSIDSDCAEESDGVFIALLDFFVRANYGTDNLLFG